MLYFIIIAVFTSCVRTEISKLPANYFYDGTYIDIHSPNQKDWSLMKKDQTQIVFAKFGDKYNESYIARVVFFPLEKMNSDKELLKLLSESAIKSSNEERFTLLESNIQDDPKRKYPCILAKMLYKDKMAKTKKGNKEQLLMQVKALYCKDPKRKNSDAGFMIGYSVRGEKISPSFDSEADSFIQGVEFKQYK